MRDISHHVSRIGFQISGFEFAQRCQGMKDRKTRGRKWPRGPKFETELNDRKGKTRNYDGDPFYFGVLNVGFGGSFRVADFDFEKNGKD